MPAFAGMTREGRWVIGRVSSYYIRARTNVF